MIKATCLFSECSRDAVSLGLCRAHYRQQRAGKPLAPLRVPQQGCSIDECARPHLAQGWCEAHYRRWRAHGDPLAGRRIQYPSPEECFVALAERQGDCLIWTGSTYTNGYGQIHVDGRGMPVHRYAWERVNGPIPEGKLVDHRDHCDVRCCDLEHLRLATVAQNNSNRAGPRPGRVEDLPRNVDRHGPGYMVRVGKGGKTYYFGTYATAEEAAGVASDARHSLFGDFAGRG